MEITAVVPVLDEELRLAGAVGRLKSLGVHDIIVVDGGSEDATIEVARSLGVRVLRSARGRAHQMNRGALEARGDVLWFVHADVRPPAHAVEQIHNALSCPTVVGGAFRTRTVCDRGTTRLRPVLPVADVRSHYTRLPYGDQALFVRRAVFERVGGFPPQVLLEDLELARRLWACGKLVIAEGKVEVSARRFLSRPVYYTAVMNLFPVLYRAGVSAQRLARLYENPR